MREERGFSLIVLVITIIVILILTTITFRSSNEVIDDAVDSKNKAEATIDDDKIKEIMTYELAGTKELIDVEIDLKRIELSDTLKIKYEENEYGIGYSLYLSNEDIDKVEKATGLAGLKPFKELTKSYVVDYTTGKYKRLENEWEFIN